jgi:heat shock protein HslJ
MQPTKAPTEGERKVIRWVFASLAIIAMIYLALTWWYRIQNCSDSCVSKGFTEGEVHFKGGGRFNLGTYCECISTPIRGAQAQTPPQNVAAELVGRTWQLVKFQGGDDTVLIPDDKMKYTIEFNADGSLAARIDCNRGRGTWKSSGPNQLEFGLMALTRAACPPGSLHDRIVKYWEFIRSYVIKDGHLFLSLMADGGTYEFEPAQPDGESWYRKRLRNWITVSQESPVNPISQWRTR